MTGNADRTRRHEWGAAIERPTPVDGYRENEAVQQANEQLQTSLIDSISHDLSMPLSPMIGVPDILQEGEADGRARQKLIQVDREQDSQPGVTARHILLQDLKRVS
jgi:K+-sensing histidine kinase KdpD